MQVGKKGCWQVLVTNRAIFIALSFFTLLSDWFRKLLPSSYSIKCSWDPTVPYPLTDERLWLLSWKYVGNNLSVDAQKRKNCNKGMDSQRFFKWVLLFISLFKLTISLLSLYLRVTRKLTSNAVYFRDLTKKWYLLFSWGKTSTYHHSYNRVLYLTSQKKSIVVLVEFKKPVDMNQ